MRLIFMKKDKKPDRTIFFQQRVSCWLTADHQKRAFRRFREATNVEKLTMMKLYTIKNKKTMLISVKIGRRNYFSIFLSQIDRSSKKCVHTPPLSMIDPWFRLTLSSLCPLFFQSINVRYSKRKSLGNVENWALDHWVQRENAVLFVIPPPPHQTTLM